MITATLDFLSRNLLRLETRFGPSRTACILATLMMGCAMIYVQPVLTVAFHGIQFSALSENPFDITEPNPLRYRILTPLLGYLLFLRGEYFFLLPLLTAWIFTATVYYTYRIKKYEPIDAFLFTCFITFSCVILIPLVAPGYTDVVTWLLIFLAFHSAGKPIRSALFFSLALLNHESSLVILPALILTGYDKEKKNAAKTLLYYLLACLPHLAYRWLLDANTETLYNLSFYLSRENVIFTLTKLVLFLPAGIFYTFKLWWIFPVCFIAWSFYLKNYRRGMILLLVLAGAFSLVLISYDYTRMLVISFPAVLLSYEWFMEYFSREKLRKFTMVLIVLNFLILQYHFNYDGAQPMFPWILNKISAAFGIPLV